MGVKYFVITVIFLMALLFVVSVKASESIADSDEELVNELEKELFVKLFGKQIHHGKLNMISTYKDVYFTICIYSHCSKSSR
jgi:uncharacterized membrane protein SpoIIM required for sporulation